MSRRSMYSAAAALLAALAAAPAYAAPDPPRIVVGAKKFTEGAVLGELMAQIL